MSARRNIPSDPLRLPAPETKLRGVYDKLRTGSPVHLEKVVRRGVASRMVDSLRDTYGCEIKSMGCGEWVLLGRWKHADFIPLEELGEDQ